MPDRAERGALAVNRAGAGEAFVQNGETALMIVRGHPSLSLRDISPSRGEIANLENLSTF